MVIRDQCVVDLPEDFTVTKEVVVDDGDGNNRNYVARDVGVDCVKINGKVYKKMYRDSEHIEIGGKIYKKKATKLSVKNALIGNRNGGQTLKINKGSDKDDQSITRAILAGSNRALVDNQREELSVDTEDDCRGEISESRENSKEDNDRVEEVKVDVEEDSVEIEVVNSEEYSNKNDKECAIKLNKSESFHRIPFARRVSSFGYKKPNFQCTDKKGKEFDINLNKSESFHQPSITGRVSSFGYKKPNFKCTHKKGKDCPIKLNKNESLRQIPIGGRVSSCADQEVEDCPSKLNKSESFHQIPSFGYKNPNFEYTPTKIDGIIVNDEASYNESVECSLKEEETSVGKERSRASTKFQSLKKRFASSFDSASDKNALARAKSSCGYEGHKKHSNEYKGKAGRGETALVKLTETCSESFEYERIKCASESTCAEGFHLGESVARDNDNKSLNDPEEIASGVDSVECFIKDDRMGDISEASKDSGVLEGRITSFEHRIQRMDAAQDQRLSMLRRIRLLLSLSDLGDEDKSVRDESIRMMRSVSISDEPDSNHPTGIQHAPSIGQSSSLDMSRNNQWKGIRGDKPNTRTKESLKNNVSIDDSYAADDSIRKTHSVSFADQPDYYHSMLTKYELTKIRSLKMSRSNHWKNTRDNLNMRTTEELKNSLSMNDSKVGMGTESDIENPGKTRSTISEAIARHNYAKKSKETKTTLTIAEAVARYNLAKKSRGIANHESWESNATDGSGMKDSLLGTHSRAKESRVVKPSNEGLAAGMKTEKPCKIRESFKLSTSELRLTRSDLTEYGKRSKIPPTVESRNNGDNQGLESRHLWRKLLHVDSEMDGDAEELAKRTNGVDDFKTRDGDAPSIGTDAFKLNGGKDTAAKVVTDEYSSDEDEMQQTFARPKPIRKPIKSTRRIAFRTDVNELSRVLQSVKWMEPEDLQQMKEYLEYVKASRKKQGAVKPSRKKQGAV